MRWRQGVVWGWVFQRGLIKRKTYCLPFVFSVWIHFVELHFEYKSNLSWSKMRGTGTTLYGAGWNRDIFAENSPFCFRTLVAITIIPKGKLCSCVFITRRTSTQECLYHQEDTHFVAGSLFTRMTSTQATLTRWLSASASVSSKWSRLPHERKRNENYVHWIVQLEI